MNDLKHDSIAPVAISRALGPTGVVPGPSLGSHLSDLWDDLSRRASEPNAFGRRWFVEPSLDHFGVESSETLVAMQQGQAIGIFPLRKQLTYGRIPVPHRRNFVHPNMFLSPVTLASGQEDLAWASLLHSLAGLAAFEAARTRMAKIPALANELVRSTALVQAPKTIHYSLEAIGRMTVDRRLRRPHHPRITIQPEIIVRAIVDDLAIADHRGGTGNALMRPEERILQPKRPGRLADQLHVALAGQFPEGARRTGGGAFLFLAPGKPLQQRETRGGGQAEALRHFTTSAAAGAGS